MIRYAKTDDIKKIEQLGKILHNNFAKLFNIPSMLEDELAKVIVYEDDGEVIGFVIATCLYETVDILSIIVDNKYRRKRIASNLLDYLFSELNESVELVTLEVAVNNDAAIKLYEKFGFEIIHTRKKYYNDIDAYLMGRRVK